MTMSLHSGKWLRRGIIAGAIAVIAGCAGAPLRPEVPTADPDIGGAKVITAAPVAQTPQSSSQLVQSADLAEEAKKQGFTRVIRRGDTFYCYRDKDIGTLIPTTKCYKPDELRSLLELRAERQASLRQQAARGGGCGAMATGC